MKEFSVLMALVDYLPVVFFLIGTVYLQRDMYGLMSKGAFALFAAGTIDVFCAGFLKATYKLLYALGICDFEPLSAMFFPVQSIGFLLAGVAMIAMMTHKQGSGTRTLSVAAVPVLWKGTFLFVSFMIAGLAGLCLGLGKICFSLKKKPAALLFLLSFFCSCCMGYMASKTFDKAIFNWIAEFINIAGQGTFMLGAIVIHKALAAEGNPQNK